MRLHVIDLGWVEYVTLRYVVSAGTGRLHLWYLQKLFLPIVYNGLSATIFCVTKKIVHIATRLPYYQKSVAITPRIFRENYIANYVFLAHLAQIC